MTDKKILNSIAEIMIHRNHTVAVAESVTAGLLQQSFAAAENAMNFFEGGITAYNIGQKLALLKINKAHARSCNCVSAKVAAQMAIGIVKLFGTDWGIAVTGYASPVSELNIKKLFAYYAIVYNDKLLDYGCIEPVHKRVSAVQQDYACEILNRYKVAIAKAACLQTG